MLSGKVVKKRKAKTEDDDGPPDKHRDFQSSKYSSSGCYVSLNMQCCKIAKFCSLAYPEICIVFQPTTLSIINRISIAIR